MTGLTSKVRLYIFVRPLDVHTALSFELLVRPHKQPEIPSARARDLQLRDLHCCMHPYALCQRMQPAVQCACVPTYRNSTSGISSGAVYRCILRSAPLWCCWEWPQSASSCRWSPPRQAAAWPMRRSLGTPVRIFLQSLRPRVRITMIWFFSAWKVGRLLAVAACTNQTQ